MQVSMQLIQLVGETLVEVAGISELNGIYLENTDVDVSVECIKEANEIKLSIKPNDKESFTSCSFTIHIIAQRIVLAQLVSGSTMLIVPDSVDENLSDTQAIKESLKTNGGIWIDGLPKEHIREIIKYCFF